MLRRVLFYHWLNPTNVSLRSYITHHPVMGGLLFQTSNLLLIAPWLNVAPDGVEALESRSRLICYDLRIIAIRKTRWRLRLRFFRNWYAVRKVRGLEWLLRATAGVTGLLWLFFFNQEIFVGAEIYFLEVKSSHGLGFPAPLLEPLLPRRRLCDGLPELLLHWKFRLIWRKRCIGTVGRMRVNIWTVLTTIITISTFWFLVLFEGFLLTGLWLLVLVDYDEHLPDEALHQGEEEEVDDQVEGEEEGEGLDVGELVAVVVDDVDPARVGVKERRWEGVTCFQPLFKRVSTYHCPSCQNSGTWSTADQT